ncbi:MAG: hypothetical protein QM778_13015 [Myxococcales bacterium]
MARLVLFLALFLAVLSPLAPAPVQADEMFSFRGGLSFGQRRTDRSYDPNYFITALSLTGDMLWGPARHGTFRFGPAFEARTTNLSTLEGAYGLTLQVPLPLSMALTANGMIGLAWRAHAEDGWMGIGTVTLGYRSYNYHGWYGYGLNLFFSGRKQINDDYLVEYTGGVEVDMLFVTVIPYMAIRNWLNKGDPHEDE